MNTSAPSESELVGQLRRRHEKRPRVAANCVHIRAVQCGSRRACNCTPQSPNAHLASKVLHFVSATASIIGWENYGLVVCAGDRCRYRGYRSYYEKERHNGQDLGKRP
mmetsp:Transcript_61016/g.176695  ORF Transcript_61016/g.176695 Transcript_61016/m.176695 type:complete len:108 (-) Transcript_61016:92-415(-)